MAFQALPRGPRVVDERAAGKGGDKCAVGKQSLRIPARRFVTGGMGVTDIVRQRMVPGGGRRVEKCRQGRIIRAGLAIEQARPVQVRLS